MRLHVLLVVAISLVAERGLAEAQSVTGTLAAIVRDAQGRVVEGATVRVASHLLGWKQSQKTDRHGQLRFLALPPGEYAVDVEAPGFAPYREEGVRIGVGANLERTVVLRPAGVRELVVVQGSPSRMDVRDSGFSTRFGPDVITTTPTRRFSMFDFIRMAPGASATTPGSVSSNSVSVFGSGTNENAFLIDGTNFTCPCSGEARSEPGVDFIEEVSVQSAGASAEFGSIQGAVINVVTRQGGERFVYDAAYYGQSAALTVEGTVLPEQEDGCRAGEGDRQFPAGARSRLSVRLGLLGAGGRLSAPQRARGRAATRVVPPGQGRGRARVVSRRQVGGGALFVGVRQRGLRLGLRPRRGRVQARD